jgi:EAL domain-containing protein (putative c-di-GMP-specific phosphodiesterase class I)/HAMP domain-containing protein
MNLKLNHTPLRTLLGLGISAIFLLLAVALLASNLLHTRAWLQNQLATHAQDTATALSMRLAEPMSRRDLPAAISNVDAVYDRGYFRMARVFGADGQPWVQRHTEIVVEGVPDWFVRHVPLYSIPAESEISHGWRQIGKVVVAAHPGHAYRELWASSVAAANVLLAAWLVAVLCVVGLLRWALGPLAALEAQARAVGEGRFNHRRVMARTSDLENIAGAMHRMSLSVERNLNTHAEELERLRAERLQDAITGLPNRASLLARLDQIETGTEALLAIAHVNGVEALNARAGYAAGNELLKEAARSLDHTAQTLNGARVYRLDGAQIALLAPGAGEAAAHACLAAFIDTARALCEREPGCAVHLGACIDARPAVLLARADAALRAARAREGSAYELHGMQSQDAPQVARRFELARAALEGDALVLHAQPVRTPAGAVLYREVFARVRDDSGVLLPAAHFLPETQRQGHAALLDARVLEIALAEQHDAPLGVNLSAASLSDADALGRLAELLARRAQGARVVLEIPEHALAPGLEARLAPLRGAGVELALDQFGLLARGVTRLRALHPDYLKVDASLIRALDQDPERQRYLRILRDITHDLGVRLLALQVETDNERRALVELGFDGWQGHLEGPPTALSNS